MPPATIVCPHCGKRLRLPEKLTARRGKCPNCHQLVDFDGPPATSPTSGEARPAVSIEASPSATQPVTAPSETLLGDTGEEHPAPHQDPSALVIDASTGTERLREIRRRSARRRNTAFLASGVIVVFLVGALFFTADGWPPAENVDRSAADEPTVSNASAGSEPPAANPASAQQPPDPISLQLIPAGSRLILHVRPADLWQFDTVGTEIRHCLGSLGDWAEQQIREWCLFEPADIQEALFCLIPTDPETPPDVAVVVRLVRPYDWEDLARRIGGSWTDEHSQPVYMSAGRAYYLADERTLASAPEKLAAEMVGAVEYPNPTSSVIEEMLTQTDRRRHLTMILEAGDLRLERVGLFPDELRPLTTAAADWLGQQATGVAWSLDVFPQFDSRLFVRCRVASESGRVLTSKDLESGFGERVDSFPEVLLQLIQKLSPATAGRRRLVGRFPAMVKVAQLSSTVVVEDRLLTLSTTLPEKAGPNLALAAVLTWQEYVGAADP